MKIKTKKQLNLPQLIEWGFENEVASSVFWTTNRKDGFQNKACFDIDGNFFTSDEINFKDTFTVEEEIEIMEDTELDLIERFIDATGNINYTSFKTTIKDCLRCVPEEYTTTHFYIENDDRELVLIWRDGKLVE